MYIIYTFKCHALNTNGKIQIVKHNNYITHRRPIQRNIKSFPRSVSVFSITS